MRVCHCTGACRINGSCGISRPIRPYVPNTYPPQVSQPWPTIHTVPPKPRKIKSVEYHEDGSVKRVEYED